MDLEGSYTEDDMKKANDTVIEKLLEMCKLIKWQNITEEEYEKMKGYKNAKNTRNQ